MLDNTVIFESFDEGICNRAWHGSHETNAESHKPEWDAGDKKHFAFESANTSISQHKIAITSDIWPADFEDASTSGGVFKRYTEIIDHVLNGNWLRLVLHPIWTGHNRK